MRTLFICRKHEDWVKALDAAGILFPYVDREHINHCCIQPGTSSISRCTGIATGWRVAVNNVDVEMVRGHNTAALAERLAT